MLMLSERRWRRRKKKKVNLRRCKLIGVEVLPLCLSTTSTSVAASLYIYIATRGALGGLKFVS